MQENKSTQATVIKQNKDGSWSPTDILMVKTTKLVKIKRRPTSTTKGRKPRFIKEK